jgi:fructokinase
MSPAATRGPVVCLGDPLLDLICERPLERLADADRFVPHLGGVAANLAVVAARAGAQVLLAGGAGEDEWGAWMSEHLSREGVGLEAFHRLPGRRTALAFVTVDGEGEAAYSLYGEVDGATVEAVGDRLEAVLEGAGALCIGSNTLAGQAGRELTGRARELALERGLPVIFDPNLRLHRWRSTADAAASANACVPGALLVRCNAAEAEVMTGEADPEWAALALVKAGARLVVISLGAEGAMLRGELRADVPAVPVAQMRSTVGAGDALTGVLLARLAQAGFYPPAAAAALPEAVAAAAAACGHWGALD